VRARVVALLEDIFAEERRGGVPYTWDVPSPRAPFGASEEAAPARDEGKKKQRRPDVSS
jgi:hypothetical protein